MCVPVYIYFCFFAYNVFAQFNDCFRRAIKDWVRHKRSDTVRRSVGTSPPPNKRPKLPVGARPAASLVAPTGNVAAAAASAALDRTVQPSAAPAAGGIGTGGRSRLSDLLFAPFATAAAAEADAADFLANNVFGEEGDSQ